MSMKNLQVLLVAVAGAAAAIPGLAVTRQFELPGGSGPLFEFVLVTVSAALVLGIYVLRPEVTGLSARTTALFATGGIVGILVFFVLHVGLTSVVMVEHRYEGQEAERLFFPLFVGEEAREAIDSAGSRRAFIENRPVAGQAFAGPAGVSQLTNEWNTAATLAVLLLTYSALVGTTALVFAFLGFYALGNQPPGEEGKTEEEDEANVAQGEGNTPRAERQAVAAGGA